MYLNIASQNITQKLEAIYERSHACTIVGVNLDPEVLKIVDDDSLETRLLKQFLAAASPQNCLTLSWGLKVAHDLIHKLLVHYKAAAGLDMPDKEILSMIEEDDPWQTTH